MLEKPMKSSFNLIQLLIFDKLKKRKLRTLQQYVLLIQLRRQSCYDIIDGIKKK